MWIDNEAEMPLIQSKNKNEIMVADFLDEKWNILQKDVMELTINIRLDFLEYMSIKQGMTKFI